MGPWDLHGALCVQRRSFGRESFMPQYTGTSENYKHPFDSKCSPHCLGQQESVPYILPVLDATVEQKHEFLELIMESYFGSSWYNGKVILLCSSPTYACSFFHGIHGVPILGYFGLPPLYFAPLDPHAQAKWLVQLKK